MSYAPSQKFCVTFFCEGRAMTDDNIEHLGGEIIPFSRRPIPPRVCVVENKTHVRMFLADMLDELGFIVHEADATEIRTLLREFRPDLIVAGPLDTDLEVQGLLRTLQTQTYGGFVMLFGGRSSEGLTNNQAFGEQIRLAMLPPLGTPFRARDLDANLDRFLPVAPPPPLPIDVDEALRNGWLELWYQSKIDTQSLVPRGAEALVRVRHPKWGVVAPSYFIPAVDDPYLHALSRFVLARAFTDSVQFASTNNPVPVSAPLPLLALEDLEFIDRTIERLPEKTRRNGLLISLDCIDFVGDPALVRYIGAQLAMRNIGMIVSDIDAEGAALASCRDLPIVEIKVGRRFIRGCADDRIKQARCAEIVAIAHDSGAKSVAEGVQTQADFVAVRDLGFDLVQGDMFAKPMAPGKFERAMLARHYAAVA
jgi:EAL domain-containing protein (putative c-di-GMP-specific phosphodiesterase class I)